MVNCTRYKFLAEESLEVLVETCIKWLNMSGEIFCEVDDFNIGEVGRQLMPGEVVLREDFAVSKLQVNIPPPQLLQLAMIG